MKGINLVRAPAAAAASRSLAFTLQSLSICISIRLSIYRSVCLDISLSLSLSLFLSIYLSPCSLTSRCFLCGVFLGVRTLVSRTLRSAPYVSRAGGGLVGWDGVRGAKGRQAVAAVGSLLVVPLSSGRVFPQAGSPPPGAPRGEEVLKPEGPLPGPCEHATICSPPTPSWPPLIPPNLS